MASSAVQVTLLTQQTETQVASQLLLEILQPIFSRAEMNLAIVTETYSDSEADSDLRLIAFFHSTLGLREIKKKKKTLPAMLFRTPNSDCLHLP